MSPTHNPDFESRLDRYAEILVRHGVDLRAGQEVFLHAEVAHRELALRVAEAAYDAGAGHVDLRFVDPRAIAQMIRRSQLERLETQHTEETAWLNRALVSRAALISLRGEEEPRLLPALAESHPERHAVYSRAASLKGKTFSNHGINRSLCPWVVAAGATPGWAARVFPDLEGDTALDRLWRCIFRFTAADRDDSVDYLAAKDRRLHGRRARLDALGIRELHVRGPGTDLRVGLSEKARWLGGSKVTADGRSFNANVPSEENFTTPDRRRTRGSLAATMPFRTKSGVLVEDLVMHFEAGRMTHFEAGRGADGFGRWVDTDEGARYLGEFALVGNDSPIAESGLFFEHTLFDENAWAHAALGQAYSSGLRGGEGLSQAELDACGANQSAIHTDIMFGSPEVTITATECSHGSATVLIERGEWAEPFRDPSL
ncbi:MAG: aminopeptidase [Thermoanaerobaculia bacterium]|nr:aminopeptidase [Thermoanaerobaculia bacterium]